MAASFKQLRSAEPMFVLKDRPAQLYRSVSTCFRKPPSLFCLFVFPFHWVKALVSCARQPLSSQVIKGGIFLTFLARVSSQSRRLKWSYAMMHLCGDSVLASWQDHPHEQVQWLPDKGSWPLVTWKTLRNAKCSSFQLTGCSWTGK